MDKQKISESIIGTKIYLFLLTMVNFIWLYCMKVRINLFVIASFAFVFSILFLLYKKHGRKYALSIINGNVFFSLLCLVLPFTLLAVNAALAKRFFLRDFIVWCGFSSVAIFVFSALSGLIISFLPSNDDVSQKIKLWTRIKIILTMFLILILFYVALYFDIGYLR